MKTLTRHAGHLLLLATLFVPGASAQQSGSTISTQAIFDALVVRPGMTVCEMGAGDGELTVAAARAVGEAGRVHTSELGEDRVKTLRANVARSGLSQITVVEGSPSATNFGASTCDVLFMRNVYHHFADPRAINASISESLKPGGRVAVVDFAPPGNEGAGPADRAKDGTHGVTAATVASELKDAGFDSISSEAGSQRWFLVVAAKPRG